MSEIDTEVVRRLVTGRKHDGRANEVEIDLSHTNPGELLPVLELLMCLPCSDPTTR